MISENQIQEKASQLFENIEFTKEPAGLYDPLRYMIAIGGKRIRPRLCLLAYSLFKDTFGKEIEAPAQALEVFHTFTLIHDDIMDHSALRRGNPTVWKKWGEVTAILSGDVMLIDAYKRMESAPQEARSLFTRTAAQVCEGQQFDMEFESRSDVTIEEYLKMIGLKTSVLIACSAKMGAILAGADQKQADAIYKYGYDLGLAFQIEDDYLDAFGQEKTLGKPIGGDIIENKKSWLIITAGKAIEEAMALPIDTPEQRQTKIDAVKAIYKQQGVDLQARKAIEQYTQSAIDAVQNIGLSAVKLEALRRFANSLVGRSI